MGCDYNGEPSASDINDYKFNYLIPVDNIHEYAAVIGNLNKIKAELFHHPGLFINARAEHAKINKINIVLVFEGRTTWSMYMRLHNIAKELIFTYCSGVAIHSWGNFVEKISTNNLALKEDAITRLKKAIYSLQCRVDSLKSNDSLISKSEGLFTYHPYRLSVEE